MRRRVAEQAGPQVEIPPWVTHLEAGLRHIGSVTGDGVITLEGVEELYRRRDEWLRENGLDPAVIL